MAFLQFYFSDRTEHKTFSLSFHLDLNKFSFRPEQVPSGEFKARNLYMPKI